MLFCIHEIILRVSILSPTILKEPCPMALLQLLSPRQDRDVYSEVMKQAGLGSVRRTAETPFNIVLEAPR